MRKLTTLAVLALAACNENTGWNPNYGMSATPYGEYLRERETALTGKGPVPVTIPVELPANAPTPAEIAGTSGQAQQQATVPARPVAAPPAAPAAAAVGTGPYPGSTPVLVRYAHSERHNPGTTLYPRTGASAQAATRACRGYASAASAQTAFIAAGGPIIDPRGLDPDGDGFVCGWDPRPYRQSQL